MCKTLDSVLADLTSGDENTAETCIANLGKLSAEQELLAALEELTTSPNSDNRWWAVRTLAEFPDPQVPSLLIQALGDKDPAVRQCAALGLSRHPDPLTVPALITALSDQDQLTANLAGFTLAQIGKPAVSALLEMVDNGSPAVLVRAVRALATIADTQAVPALIAALDNDSAPMEHWANKGLERMGVGMILFDPQ